MNFEQKRIWRRSRWRINPAFLLWMTAMGRSDDVVENISSVAIINTARQFVETRKVTVDCNADHMCVHVPIDLDELKLPDCFERKTGHFCTSDLSGCGTNFNVLNDTHVLYSNEVGYGESSVITWKCLYPVETITNLNLSTKRSQMKEIGIIAQAPAGAGRFYVSFQLYSDSSYKYPFGFRPRLPRDGVMRGRVTLHNHTSLSRATVQLTRCWATPTADPKDGFNMIDNFCPVKSGAEVKLLNSGTDYYATFESGVFKFTKSESVYLHCHIRICFRRDNEADNCAIRVDQCPDNRVRRSLEPNPDTTISIGPIDVKDAVVIEDLEKDGTFDAQENYYERNNIEDDNKIRIDPALLWSLLIALMVAAVGLGVILVYWLKEDHKQSMSTEILKNSNRGSISSVETA